MPLVPEITDITGHTLIPLEKKIDGKYPYPRMRYGILPYWRTNSNEIVWGCIESNRVEPVTFEPAAGTQDIIAIKDDRRLVLEAGKPVPDFTDEEKFLHLFRGQSFREQAYQDVLSCLIVNGFALYFENPIATAIHEAYEEHGIDLHQIHGRDRHLLKSPLALSQYEIIPPQIGVTSPLGLWLPELTSCDDIELRYTSKIDKKMRRNFGREFYEKGVWITQEFFKTKLAEEKAKFSSLDAYSPIRVELITEAFKACDRNLPFLERMELLLHKKPCQEQALPIPLPSIQSIFSGDSVFFKQKDSDLRITKLVCTSDPACKAFYF